MFKRWFFNGAYCLLLGVLSPILLYRIVQQGKYRRGFRQKYLGRVPRPRKNLHGNRTSTSHSCVVWFHAVSVGEVNLLRPLLQKIEETKPDWCCVLSTTSATGMALAQKLYGNKMAVFYCPLDFSWAVDTALQRIEPAMLVLTEQELWPNLIDVAKNRGVKIAVVNGRMSETGYHRYRWIRPLIASMLRKIDSLAVQSETYAGWFHHLGMPGDRIQITGSMKFDGACSDRNNVATQACRTLAGISEADIVFLRHPDHQ